MKRCHQDRAQRAKTRPTAASEPSRLRMFFLSRSRRGETSASTTGGIRKHNGRLDCLFRFLCSISAYEKPSGDTRAHSLCLNRLRSIFGALGTPAKPNRDVPRNALLCSQLYLTLNSHHQMVSTCKELRFGVCHNSV